MSQFFVALGVTFAHSFVGIFMVLLDRTCRLSLTACRGPELLSLKHLSSFSFDEVEAVTTVYGLLLFFLHL